MRSESESERVHEIAVALLKKKGIAAERATYDEYADCAAIAAEVVASGKTGAADAVAVAALAGGVHTDARTSRVLARFANDGRFVSDLSISEEEFLAEAIAAELRRDTVVAAEASDVECPHGFVGGASDGCSDCLRGA